MIGWLGFAGAVGFILVIGWGFIGDFDEWWNGQQRRQPVERPTHASEPSWVAETLAEIRRLPEVVHR